MRYCKKQTGDLLLQRNKRENKKRRKRHIGHNTDGENTSSLVKHHLDRYIIFYLIFRDAGPRKTSLCHFLGSQWALLQKHSQIFIIIFILLPVTTPPSWIHLSLCAQHKTKVWGVRSRGSNLLVTIYTHCKWHWLVWEERDGGLEKESNGYRC